MHIVPASSYIIAAGKSRFVSCCVQTVTGRITDKALTLATPYMSVRTENIVDNAFEFSGASVIQDSSVLP